VRRVFKLSKDYDFYFTHKDKDNDEVAIKKSYEILNYMHRMQRNNNLKLSVTPINQEKRHINDPDSSDNASVSLNESFQSIIKNLELGMSKLQATVEKNAVTVAANTVDTVVKTAAETAAHVYRSMLPPPTLSEKPQFDVICDGCYTPIRG
jgi:gamma-glutamyl phosphate reductase